MRGPLIQVLEMLLRPPGNKTDIKVWNEQWFGNIFDNTRKAEEAVLAAEKRVEEDDSANAEWRQCLLVEEKEITINSGNWITSEDDIGVEAVRYFSSLFSVEPTSSWDLSLIIPKLLLPSDNDMLEKVPIIKEVRRVVFNMDGDSATSPDGYSEKFFTFAWDIIAQDIYNAVVSFFCEAELPRRLIATLIVLIPKV
ncbi:uncharacterized protein [Coffea arabica]|uniref:Uncharacterized protein n=1 Tax=Coffea arabica TaxID=13443 RepID=A0ABM4UR19_COFAR